MMKIWKAKLRRGFALFLALSMCLGVMQLTAIASETGTEAESEGHRHTFACYADYQITCANTDEDHQHSVLCYTYTEESGLVCGLEEGEVHVHDDTCKSLGFFPVVCGLEEHTHDEDCYDTPQVQSNAEILLQVDDETNQENDGENEDVSTPSGEDTSSGEDASAPSGGEDSGAGGVLPDENNSGSLITEENGTDPEETEENGTDPEETEENGTDPEEAEENGTDQEETEENGTDQGGGEVSQPEGPAGESGGNTGTQETEDGEESEESSEKSDAAFEPVPPNDEVPIPEQAVPLSDEPPTNCGVTSHIHTDDCYAEVFECRVPVQPPAEEVSTMEELQAAINEGKSYIKLADSIGEEGLTGNLTIKDLPSALTLDLNGKTIHGTGKGSVVTVTNSQVTIKNGVITGGNAYFGGGLYVGADAVVTLSSAGTISGNVVEHADKYNRRMAAHGGGVYVAEGGSFILDGGTIRGNRAGDPNDYGDKSVDTVSSGGGIYVQPGASLTMNSGEISGNTAVKKGGGICIGTDGNKAADVSILSGSIINNTANTGGGIYVANGSELNLKAVAVTENTANVEDWAGDGGGIWLCGIGRGLFYSTRGAYISNNTAYKRGDDFTAWYGNNTTFNFTTRLYDGTPLKWYEDGNKGEWCGPRYTDDQREVDMMDLYAFIARWRGGWGDAMSLHTKTDRSANDSYYTLRITGNTAQYGGGIACNGKLIMGENEDDVRLTIKKEWDDGENPNPPERPEKVQLTLWNGDVELDTVVLNKDNDWSVELIDLPSNGDYHLTETLPDESASDYKDYILVESWEKTTDANGNHTWTLTGTNTYSPKTVSLTVNKVWRDANGGEMTAPEGLTVTVNVKNGETVVEPLTLNAENQWAASVDGLAADGNYTVEEVPVAGFTPSYQMAKDEDGNYTFTITNTENQPDTVSLTVNKVWRDAEGGEMTAPEGLTVTVNVKNGETVLDTLTLNAENQWSAAVSNLPILEEGDYTVEESAIAGFTPSYQVVKGEDGNYTVSITNTQNAPEAVRLSVQKVWNDGTPADEHNSVMVGLYNSTGLQEYVMLSASNDWRYDWTGLEADETWRVGEVSVPGYTSTQIRDGDLVTITNTPDNDNPPPPPPGGGGNRPGNPPPVVTELPDPNVPGAPEEVTVIDEDVPLTYVKTWDPEEEEYVYVPEEEVPLADVTPETGDNRATALWAALALTSAAGLTVLNLTKPRKKEEQN